MVGITKALGIDFVHVFGPGGRAANQPFAVITLRPPMALPLPGASVSMATIGSPASSEA